PGHQRRRPARSTYWMERFWMSTEESRIREEICVTGTSLYERRYTVGSAGNISARLEDGWLITPTDACLGRLDPADIAKVDAQGNHVSGGRPSKTLTLL